MSEMPPGSQTGNAPRFTDSRCELCYLSPCFVNRNLNKIVLMFSDAKKSGLPPNELRDHCKHYLEVYLDCSEGLPDCVVKLVEETFHDEWET